MTYFPQVDKWIIPEQAMLVSFKEMARDGIHGNEGIVLWLGSRHNEQASVSHVVGLRGKGIIKRPDFLSITPEVMNDVTDLALRLGLMLVGQIHSHGPYFGIDLSPTDKLYGVCVPYYLSIVAPDYALKPTDIKRCGVHVYQPKVGYQRLSSSEVQHKILIASDQRVSISLIDEKHD